MSAAEKLPMPSFPEGMDEDEQDMITDLSEQVLNSIPLPALAALTADEIFGESIDENNENMFLKAMIDETQPVQSEFAARIAAMFDAGEINEPSCLSLQILKRKAGYSSKQEDDKLGNYCCAISLNEFQVVMMGREENVLTPGSMSRIFELKNGKKAERPYIPRNKTIIKFSNGQAKVKPRNYLSLMLWAFWADYPVKPKEKPKDSPQLQQIIESLAQNPPPEVESVTQESTSDGAVIHDQKE